MTLLRRDIERPAKMRLLFSGEIDETGELTLGLCGAPDIEAFLFAFFIISWYVTGVVLVLDAGLRGVMGLSGTSTMLSRTDGEETLSSWDCDELARLVMRSGRLRFLTRPSVFLNNMEVGFLVEVGVRPASASSGVVSA